MLLSDVSRYSPGNNSWQLHCRAGMLNSMRSRQIKCLWRKQAWVCCGRSQKKMFPGGWRWMSSTWEKCSELCGEVSRYCRWNRTGYVCRERTVGQQQLTQPHSKRTMVNCSRSADAALTVQADRMMIGVNCSGQNSVRVMRGDNRKREKCWWWNLISL